MNSPRPETLLAQLDHYLDPQSGGIVPPIQSATTFARDASYELVSDFGYARNSSPLSAQVEHMMTRLEGGEAALCFGSGMAAINAILETVATGRHIVAPAVMYHGTRDWMKRFSRERGVDLTLFDPTAPGALEAAIRPGQTDIVWVESPINPTWTVIDIEAAARAAHTSGAQLIVDSTVAPPVTTTALALGADMVFHSATKYLNGHSDVTAGVVVTRQRDARFDKLASVRTHSGGILGSFECWLLLRGMRTLALRFERACENAMTIAQHFEGHPQLEAVLYPGLSSHPGHAVAARQMTNGFGGMLSLLVVGGEPAAARVTARLAVFVRATSLGGVESLVEHRAIVEGPDSPVARNLLRLSIGIEHVQDLIADLEQALQA